jgi:ankyrin repeat protein
VETQHSQTPLIWAVHGAREEIVKMLPAMDGIDLNLADTSKSNGGTPLTWAVKSRCREIVEMLLAMDGVDLLALWTGGV